MTKRGFFTEPARSMDQGFDLDQLKRRVDRRIAPNGSIQIYPRYFTPERHHMQSQCTSGAGFSLWGFVLARTKSHRLKPVPLDLNRIFRKLG
jgi:hypothetical protein